MTDNKERQEFINTELASFIKEQGTKGVFTKCVELGFHAGFRTGERLAKIEVLEEAVKRSKNIMPNDKDRELAKEIITGMDELYLNDMSCNMPMFVEFAGNIISRIRAEVRRAAAERARYQTCKDCYNVADCGYAYNQEYECEKAQRIVDAILNEE